MEVSREDRREVDFICIIMESKETESSISSGSLKETVLSFRSVCRISAVLFPAIFL